MAPRWMSQQRDFPPSLVGVGSQTRTRQTTATICHARQFSPGDFTESGSPDEVSTMQKGHSTNIRSKATRPWAKGGSTRVTLTVVGMVFSLATGCGASTALEQARSGNYQALHEEILHNPPTNRQARQLAEATLRFEIEHSVDRRDRSFIQSLRPCSDQVPRALAARARVADGVGAEAAMLLLELDRFDRPGQYSDARDGGWRALAARASSKPDRSKHLIDPDERVRFAAISAMETSGDSSNVSYLLESAHRDPNPELRKRAIALLGSHTQPGLAGRLRDYYPQLDEALRLAVIEAWGTAPLYQEGGLRELQTVIIGQTAVETVAAAGILARDPLPDVYNPALTRLERVMNEGTTREQRLALVLMPLHHVQTTRLLIAATGSPEPQVAVIAWSRLLSHEKFRNQAKRALLKLAKQSDAGLALQAQLALATSRSGEVTPTLRANLNAPNPSTRKWAALGLLRLGAVSDASLLIADKSPEVRRAVACRILSTPATLVDDID